MKLLKPADAAKDERVAKYWNCQQLGYLLACRVIKGKANRRSSVLDLKSIHELIDFIEK